MLSVRNYRTNSWALPLFILLSFALSSCSEVSLEAARQLGVTGHSVASQAKQNVFASEAEYLRARDSEALLHGFSGTTKDKKYLDILMAFENIRREMAQRAVVFEQLAQLYDAFGELAGFDAGQQTEAALTNLSGAVQEYAKQTKQAPPISEDTTAIISKIGGLIASEIQKTKIKKASGEIRGRVDAFAKLLGNPLIREQQVGFRSFMLSDVKAALSKLWDAGVYDPKPLLDEIGATAGLAAQKDVAQVLKTNTDVRNAIGEVVDKRLSIQMDRIEQSYDSSVEALNHLVLEHKKMEVGTPLNLTRLRGIVAQMRGIVNLIVKAKNGTATNN